MLPPPDFESGASTNFATSAIQEDKCISGGFAGSTGLHTLRVVDLSDFDYDLPEELIAQHPTSSRTDSRMLVVDPATGILTDRHFTDLGEELARGDLLVLNDTKVIPARDFTEDFARPDRAPSAAAKV